MLFLIQSLGFFSNSFPPFLPSFHTPSCFLARILPIHSSLPISLLPPPIPPFLSSILPPIHSLILPSFLLSFLLSFLPFVLPSFLSFFLSFIHSFFLSFFLILSPNSSNLVALTVAFGFLLGILPLLWPGMSISSK